MNLRSRKANIWGKKQCDFIIQLLSEAVLTVRTVLLSCLVLGSRVMIQGHQKRASDILDLESQAAVSCLMFALRPKLHFSVVCSISAACVEPSLQSSFSKGLFLDSVDLCM